MLKVPMLGIWTIWAWVLVPSVKIHAKAAAKRPKQHWVVLDISMLMEVGTGNGLGGFTAKCILEDVLEHSHRPSGSSILPPIVAIQVFLTPKDSAILRFCDWGTDFSGTGITPCKRIFLDRLS
jgi:hypothetical protein